jgi:alkylation response protein AidB-like acyl-CoA dehydrogenase
MTTQKAAEIERPAESQPAAPLDAVGLAETLADEFRARAAELDRSAAFPTENYRRMRESGYLRAAVPAEFGGLGAGLSAMSRAQQALARGCASTALAVNMHHFQVGLTADLWRKGAPVEPLLRRVADEGLVLASTAAEMVVAGAWTTSTTARREEGGYRINGRKYFCSQAPGMSLVRVAALDAEAGEIVVCAVPANAAGLRVVETWDTAGMRATASHDLLLEEVWVPDAAVGGRLPPSGPIEHPLLAGLAVWFHSLLSGVYLGLGEEARAEAHRALGSGRNSSFRDPALTDVLLGELEAAFLVASATRDQVTASLERDRTDPQQALRQSILCREVVTAQAVAVVDKAIELVGGKAYFRSSPLERLARDVRAARFHPPAAPVSFQMVGQRVRPALAAGSAA